MRSSVPDGETLAAAKAATLVLHGVTVRYGGVAALSGVGLTVTPGRILGLIGPNGAGKTSLINAATGLVRLTAGSIDLGGRRIDGFAPHRIARAGIARTYQNIRLFGSLDVRTNVAAGAFARAGSLSDDEARALLADAGVTTADLDATAGGLPYGDQRRLEIARALAAHPSIVLLDEPAAGMNPVETHALSATIRGIAERGCGVLLIEHDMTLVRAICDDVVVLNFGETIAHGTPDAIARDPAVIEAYLGTESE